jgi:serine/threonine protein kinase
MCALPACVRACPPPDLVPPPYAYVVPHLVRAAQTIFKEGQRAGYSSLFIVLQGSARAYRLKTERELAKDKQAKEAREASFRAREAACGCSPSDSPQPGVPRRRQSNASTSPASAHGSNSTSSAPPTPLPANASSPLGSAEAAGGSPPPNASPNPNRPPRPPRFSGEKEEDEPNVTLGQFYVGDHFGASTILFDDGGSNERSVTIEATMALSTLALPRDAFGPLLDRVCLRLRRVLIHRQWLINRGKIELNDLEKGALLGVGGFGRVRLGLHTSGKAFAVKVVDKGKLMESSGLADQMVQERSLIATVNHTFLLRLVTARGSHSARTLHCIRAHTVHARTLRYITAHTVHAPSAASPCTLLTVPGALCVVQVTAHQSKHHLYLVTELVLGGELYTHLQSKRSVKLGVPAARFYAACVLSAFSYLHHNRVAYRDLKPENLLLEPDGYVKVIDFGFAKVVDGRTFTFCGTPDYMAPEIVRFRAQGLSVDMWAFGVFLYEMLVGRTPFQDEDVTKVYAGIFSFEGAHKGRGLAFPWFFHSDAKAAIELCLHPDPLERLTPDQACAHAIVHAPTRHAHTPSSMRPHATPTRHRPHDEHTPPYRRVLGGACSMHAHTYRMHAATPSADELVGAAASLPAPRRCAAHIRL